MKLLLDTCAFIWLVTDADKLSANAREACANPQNGLLLSVSSVWEIQLKVQNGKLRLGFKLDFAVESLKKQIGLQVLGIEEAHVFTLNILPSIHNDPFDRILIAQAKTLNASIVTSDEKIRQYPVDVIW